MQSRCKKMESSGALALDQRSETSRDNVHAARKWYEKPAAIVAMVVVLLLAVGGIVALLLGGAGGINSPKALVFIDPGHTPPTPHHTIPLCWWFVAFKQNYVYRCWRNSVITIGFAPKFSSKHNSEFRRTVVCVILFGIGDITIGIASQFWSARRW